MENIWKGNIISLRAVESSDLEGYFCNSDYEINTEDHRKGDRSIFPVSKGMMKERIDTLSKLNPYGQEFFMIIIDKDGKPVGNINTHSCSRIDGTFQYGVGIRSEYRNKGYASDSIKILLRFYFMELGYQKVETRVYAFNEESIILHRKLGFVLEGTLRRNHFSLGTWHDVYCYGMTREEFEAHYSEFCMKN